MRILVTAGNTLVPIDRVRCITNVFSGRTGAGLALHAFERGHDVTLLTSHPEVIEPMPHDPRWNVYTYRTFEHLETLMAEHIANRPPDVVIHCAAVSDYRASGVFAPAPGTRLSADNTWESTGPPTMLDRAAGKIKSDEPELWLRLVRTPKLIDRIRTDWNFQGTLVKFKLEVDIDVERLLEIAEKSRLQSGADWMVANILGGSLSAFHLGPFPTGYERVARTELPARLLDLLEKTREEHRG